MVEEHCLAEFADILQLTESEAKIYIFLTKRGLKKASEIDRALKIGRLHGYYDLKT